MTSDKLAPVSTEQSHQVTIVTINKRKFVIGLKWRGLESPRNYMKQARAVGKKEGLDVVAIRHGIGIQAGFAPKKSANLKGFYSLAVSLVSLIDGDWIGAFALPESQDGGIKKYALIAKMDGGKIIPWTDKIMTADEVESIIPELKEMILSTDNGGELKVYGDISISWVTEELTLEEILKPALLNKTYKLRPLTFGLTKKELITYSSLIGMGVFGAVSLYYYLDFLNEQRRAAEQLALIKKEQLDRKARYETALKNLVHPWVQLPSVSHFIEHCDKNLSDFPLSIKGWVVSSVECNNQALKAFYKQLPDTGTPVDAFKNEVIKKYGSNTSIYFEGQDFNVAAFEVVSSLPGNGDDPIPEIGEQTLKVFSLFQKLNINVQTKIVEIKEKAQEEKDFNLPPQDWREITYRYESGIPARMIFKDSDFLGIRIKKIIYAPNYETGAIKYSIEGSFYGK
ncbi:type 4b pilus protein PilO2 [Cronobacter sakazakii]|nr:type 4b pilus protein PilO2 [Cronobacter sakazakii]